MTTGKKSPGRLQPSEACVERKAEISQPLHCIRGRGDMQVGFTKMEVV